MALVINLAADGRWSKFMVHAGDMDLHFDHPAIVTVKRAILEMHQQLPISKVNVDDGVPPILLEIVLKDGRAWRVYYNAADNDAPMTFDNIGAWRPSEIHSSIVTIRGQMMKLITQHGLTDFDARPL